MYLNMEKLEIPLYAEVDVGLARDESMSVAEAMGMDQLAIGQVALAVSEICQNAVRYGGGGNVIISTFNQDKALRIVIEDQGPGIADISIALQEGFSTTKTSLGVGLEAAKRSVDKFLIESSPTNGTRIILEKYLPIPNQVLDYGAVSLADERYPVNGDAFLIKTFEGEKIIVAAIDGLGQGQRAHDMAIGVKKVIEARYWLPLEQLIRLCDQYLQEQCDPDDHVAMSLALIEPNSLTYLGIGDTHAYIIDDYFYPLFNIDGRVGDRQIRSLKMDTYAIKGPFIFVLCTDGINSRLDPEELELELPAQQLANQIFNRYHRSYGDVTALVIKYHPR